MTDLARERCVACRPDAPKVTADEEASLLEQIPAWNVVEVNEVRRLRRTYRFDDWMAAVGFTNQVATLANDEDHHPRIMLQWGRVTVDWWTHAIKGLHRNDFVMAAKSDSLTNDPQGTTTLSQALQE